MKEDSPITSLRKNGYLTMDKDYLDGDDTDPVDALIRKTKSYGAAGEIALLVEVIKLAMIEHDTQWLRSDICRAMCNAIGYNHKILISGYERAIGCQQKRARRIFDKRIVPLNEEEIEEIKEIWAAGAHTVRQLAYKYNVTAREIRGVL